VTAGRYGELTPMEWCDGLSVGVRSIDKEHQLMIGVLRDVSRQIADGDAAPVIEAALRDLFAYADYHFEHEQELMDAYDYPDRLEHRRQHHAFIEQLKTLDRELAAGKAGVGELVTFVRGWLVGHIADTDKKLGFYLRDRMPP
jgi:hemerythrin-like metal-binding protein